MSDNKPFKLNLWALKTNASNKNKETTESQNISVEAFDKKEIKKVETVYQKWVSSPLSKILDDEKKDKIEIIEEVKDDIKKSNVLDFSKMQSNKKEKNKIKDENKLKEENIETKNEIKEEEKDLFNNYESEFDNKKDTVLERVKKFSDYIKPKTRIWFLTLIIFITAFWITSLFILAPEKHNLKNYEANLLIAKEKIECQFDKTKCDKKEEITNKTTSNTNINTNKLNNKTLNKWLFAIEYQTKNIDWKEVIIYKWKTYNDKESFNKVVSKEIKIRKLNELKKHILENE